MSEGSMCLDKKMFLIHKDTWHLIMTLHPVLTPTSCPYHFVPTSFFLFFLNKLESIERIFFNFFLFIVWWLSEGVGFLYGVTSRNKFIIAKWKSVKLFSYFMNLLSLNFMNLYINLWEIYKNSLIYSQTESFSTHLLWIYIYKYIYMIL